MDQKASCNTQLDVTRLEALKELSRLYHGKDGEFSYQAFEHINATFFDGVLPTPFIQWAITPYGGCLGMTQSGDRPPVITLHPALLHPGEGDRKSNPWGMDPGLLGVTYAYEVLLHECMHVAVRYVRLPAYVEQYGQAPTMSTSHNNILWLAEVKRIGPLLGLSDNISLNKPRRVPVPGETTKTGKPKTKVVRGQKPGTLDFAGSVARFPHGMRKELNKMEFYRDKTPPWETEKYPVTCNYVLQIPVNT